MRNAEYEFVETDSSAVLSQLIEKYESLTGHTLHPSDPDRLFLSWVANVIIQERVNQNYVGNQNIPSRAVGENLDALGKWIYNVERKAASPAQCTMRFSISETRDTAIPIPKGTRVSDEAGRLVWQTVEDTVVPPGDEYAEVQIVCETPGVIGNDYLPGQICTLIDVDNILFYASCANTETSGGGSDEEDDETYYESMRTSLDAFSTAGAKGSYVYHAKATSSEIADVKVVLPADDRTEELPVMLDGESNKKAFVGGDHIDEQSLKVYAHGGAVATVLGTDYTVDYSDGLLVISIADDGALTAEATIDVSFSQDKAGNVYIYALTKNGAIAGEALKAKILSACNADNVRPITDYVSVKDAAYVDYTIECTYYIDRESHVSISSISANINSAIEKYKAWQNAKLGRDINPSKLQSMLMVDGVKRVVITSPTYTPLKNGNDGSVPQVARATTVTVTNGGYEDE